MSGILNIADGIKIIQEYTKNTNDGIKLYITIAICNGALTKYITLSKWDYKIQIIGMDDDGDTIYLDSNNKPMFVWEYDEPQYEIY
jgi:hypothetical protein